MDARYYIEHLQLLPHPEGGFYRETCRAEGTTGDRNYATAIYFLLTAGNFSAFHRIKSDEVWHFYAGSGLIVAEIATSGELISTRLGANVRDGEVFQYTVKAGHWFGSYIPDKEGFALVGCTVAPGFDFRDFEMAKRHELLETYPGFEAVIKKLTRE